MDSPQRPSDTRDRGEIRDNKVPLVDFGTPQAEVSQGITLSDLKEEIHDSQHGIVGAQEKLLQHVHDLQSEGTLESVVQNLVHDGTNANIHYDHGKLSAIEFGSYEPGRSPLKIDVGKEKLDGKSLASLHEAQITQAVDTTIERMRANNSKLSETATETFKPFYEALLKHDEAKLQSTFEELAKQPELMKEAFTAFNHSNLYGPKLHTASLDEHQYGSIEGLGKSILLEPKAKPQVVNNTSLGYPKLGDNPTRENAQTLLNEMSGKALETVKESLHGDAVKNDAHEASIQKDPPPRYTRSGLRWDRELDEEPEQPDKNGDNRRGAGGGPGPG